MVIVSLVPYFYNYFIMRSTPIIQTLTHLMNKRFVNKPSKARRHDCLSRRRCYCLREKKSVKIKNEQKSLSYNIHSSERFLVVGFSSVLSLPSVGAFTPYFMNTLGWYIGYTFKTHTREQIPVYTNALTRNIHTTLLKTVCRPAR